MSRELIETRRAYLAALRTLASLSLRVGRTQKDRRDLVAKISGEMKRAKKVIPGFEYVRIVDAFVLWIEKSKTES